jgi:hypothetical protein
MQLAVLTTYFNYLFGRRYIVLMLALAMLVRCIFLLRPEVGATPHHGWMHPARHRSKH